MGQVLHSSAAKTHAIRAALQRSKASDAGLAAQYHLNPKTVRKWRKRTRSRICRWVRRTPGLQFCRRKKRLPVSRFESTRCCRSMIAFCALQAAIPNLTRSSLHRLFQPHGISRLPDMKAEAEPRKKFKSYPIGYFHIDVAEVRTEEGKLHMFVAIDRTSKFAFVKLEEKANSLSFPRRSCRGRAL